MKTLPSNKKLMEEYRLSKDELFEIMNECLNYYLSEEELYDFILKLYMAKEMKINKRLQK